MKLFYVFLIGILILSSCSSSDDSADIIIGKWRAIEQYESNQLVDMPTCLPHIYTEYKADNSVSGGKIFSNDFPEECNLLMFDLGVVWENLGNGNYRFGYSNEQGNIQKVYKDGLNLVFESPNGVTKVICEPY
ncbi:hypothetical protein [Flavobacterium sp.]|uniref:hypothetical protein n=1 Tax=Flavobacterium sp. TaxID=239 RepID=UPI0025C2F546|nr:hypothetical protein [Flavobacterium sp.]